MVNYSACGVLSLWRSSSGLNRPAQHLSRVRLSPVPSHQLQRSCRGGSSSTRRVHTTRGQVCLPRCRSCLPLCINTCSDAHTYACPHLKNRSSYRHSRQARAHVTCWRRHVKPIDRVRAQQATCMLLRRSRAPIRRGRVAWTRSRRRGGRAGSPSYARARGSFLSRRSACPVNPRHGHGEGAGGDAGGGHVIMVFPPGRSGAMAPAPATWRTYACWTGVWRSAASSVGLDRHTCVQGAMHGRQRQPGETDVHRLVLESWAAPPTVC